MSHELKDNKFKLKIYHKTDARFIETDAKLKLSEFLRLVMKEFKLEDEKETNVRLRQYKPQEDLMTETFTGMEERELLYLGITPNKAYAVERKADHESFAEYDASLMKVKCYLWDENVVSSDSDQCKAVFVSIGRRRPIKDFEDCVRRAFEIPEQEYFYMFKRRVINDSLKEAALLNSQENLIYSLEEMKIYEATKVLIERIPAGQNSGRPAALVDFKEEGSRWVGVIERENYTLLIRFNLPSLTPNSECASFDQELLVDSRLSLSDLKKLISDSMEIEEDKFIMRRGGKVGVELTDLTKSLIKTGMVSGSVIYTAFGTPTKPGEILLKILTTIKTDEEILHHYNLRPLLEIAVDQSDTPSQVIEKVVEKCKREGGNDMSQMSFRLREKHSRSLVKVYRDIALKRQGIHEGKQLVLENINPDLQVRSLDLRQFLLVVQILNPETIDFEEVFEFALERTDTMATIAQKLFEKYKKIPIEFMEAAKVSTVWGLDRLYGLNLPYVKFNDNKQVLTGQPFFIGADGVVILYV